MSCSALASQLCDLPSPKLLDKKKLVRGLHHDFIALAAFLACLRKALTVLRNMNSTSKFRVARALRLFHPGSLMIAKSALLRQFIMCSLGNIPEPVADCHL